MADAIKLVDVIKQLDASAVEIMSHFEEIDKSNLSELCTSFRRFGIDLDSINNTVKLLNATYEKLSQDTIPTALENAGFDSVTVKDHVYSVNARLRASCPEAMREKGHAWLRTQGFSALIKETVNPQTLSGAMKDYITEKGLNPPEDCVKIHTHKYMSVRKK